MSSASTDDAFGAIYDEHFGFVWAVLRRLGVAEADLEDVVQEVFIVVHRRLHAFEARASIRTWIYAIAVRVYLNHARRRRNQPVLAETSSSTLPAVDGDPERFAEQREAGGLVHDLLGKLDPVKRTVFVLAELEGLTAPQIARITGANERTVYSRLRAARSSFAAGLARARARERNDEFAGAHLRELSRRVDDRPPMGAQQRTWAALLLQLAAEPAVPLVAVGLGVGLRAAGLSLGLGVAALGLVYAVTIPVRATEPRATGIAEDRVDDARDSSAPGRSTADGPEPNVAAAAIVAPAADSAPAPAPGTGSASAPGSGSPSAPASGCLSVSGCGSGSGSGSARVPASAPAPTALAATANATPIASAALPTASPDDAVTSELALLQSARDALRDGNPDRSLRALDEHARRFPEGKLAPERDRSRVTALCAVGRTQDAEALARTLALPQPACKSGVRP